MPDVGYGSQDDDGTWGFRDTGDGKILLGNTADDVISITGSLDIKGNNIVAPTTQDLGSGANSSLSINSSMMFLDANQITAADQGFGNFAHKLTIPNGTTSGQMLTIVVESTFGPSNNVPIMLDINTNGVSSGALQPGSMTSATFVYYKTSSISAWYQV